MGLSWVMCPQWTNHRNRIMSIFFGHHGESGWKIGEEASGSTAVLSGLCGNEGGMFL